MKIIVTAGRTFGPFAEVQTLSDHYLADGVVLPFGVIGDAVVQDQGDWKPPAPPPPVPQAVTRRQAKQALLLAGLLDSVQPAIDAIPDATQRGLVQIEWDDSQEFERNRPALISLGTALGLTSGQLDALFITAAGLP